MKQCPECHEPSWRHALMWFEEFFDHMLPDLPVRFFPKKFDVWVNTAVQKFFTATKVARMASDFKKQDVPLRSWTFIEEAARHGWKCRVLVGPFGITNHYEMAKDGKKCMMEGLPLAEFANGPRFYVMDDKAKTKELLRGAGFPVPRGKMFWAWNMKRALRYGRELGVPLVVKPRGGSVARHVTTNIKTPEELKKGIWHALTYSPAFLVEEYMPGRVHRATVIDQREIFCARQEPANVAGDGVRTITELVTEKNKDPRRGMAEEKDRILFKIIMNETSDKVLAAKGCSRESVPRMGEKIFVQKDPFLKLGGDVVEMTGEVHPDNIELFRRVAEFFDVRVVAMDVMMEDATKSWQDQRCGILELNSLPCIEMHHYPSSGTPQDVASALMQVMEKYYR